jgi:hypothetical protein
MEYNKFTITPTTVTIDIMKGYIMTKNDDLSFLQKICKIDTSQYEFIYKLDDGWTGGYFFLSGNKYRIIKCGSGVPIVSDKSGVLRKIVK